MQEIILIDCNDASNQQKCGKSAGFISILEANVNLVINYDRHKPQHHDIHNTL